MKAHAVAESLRKLADSLDRKPDSNIEQAWVTFYCRTNKEHFLNLATLMPRPFSKDFDGDQIDLIHGDFKGPLHLKVTAARSAVCTVIEPARPAVYDCSSLLSDAEMESIHAD